MNRSRVLNSKRDIPLFVFLWKWKVATTAALYLKFFSNSCIPKRAYNRLLVLRRAGFIEAKSNLEGDKSVWTLTKRGFEVIRPLLPGLRSEGFGCEYIGHDLLVSAVHLGDFFFALPPNCELFSEQELRRFTLDEFPAYVPQTEMHRPDGFWHFTSGIEEKTIALEVELTTKRLSDYDKIARYYAYYENISSVLWVVSSRSLINKLQDKLFSVSSRNRDLHNFALVNEFSQDGWRAAICSGPDQGITLAEWLRAKPVQTACNYPAHPMLETRRSGHISMAYRFQPPTKKPNWVPNPPTFKTHDF
jgi:hypothetical protein